MTGMRSIPILVGLALLAAACSPTAVNSSGVAWVGPSLENDSRQTGGQRSVYTGTKLDVIVQVFNPGLPDDPDDYEENNIWPELRRTEANRFSVNMKSALEDTGVFGDVSVSPVDTTSGALYVFGGILESNGEDVSIWIEVRDSSNRQWYRKDYSHRVKEYFYRNPRNQGLDAYAPVFETAAADIARELRGKGDEYLARLREIQKIHWAASLSPEKFGGYLQQKDGVFQLAGLPDRGDPALARTQALYVQEGVFLDRMQEEYEKFVTHTDESYAAWQKDSLAWTKAQREAEEQAWTKGILGSVGLIASVALAASGNSSDSGLAEGIGAVGALASGVLIAESFQSRADMKHYRDTLNELSGSTDAVFQPTVVEIEGESEKLTGDARKQFEDWRAFLKMIHDKETGQN